MSKRWLSQFIVATGPRGGCKTVLQTVKESEALIKSYYLGFNVWSNYPVGFYHRDYRDGKVVYLKPQPLNMEAFYTFDKGLVHGWVFIDEIDQWYDRQEWNTVTQKMINSVLQMIRKRHLSVMATIQDFNWLNSRGQFQVDVIVQCRDAYFTPWGRATRKEPGEVANLTWIDKSGMRTGYTYEESGRYFKNTLYGKWAWNKYDTDYIFDPLEAKTRYRLKLKTKEIDATRRFGDNIEILEENGLRSEKKNGDEILVADFLYQVTEQGINQIPSPDLYFQLQKEGFHGSTHDLRKVMTSLGFSKDEKNKYILAPPKSPKKKVAVKA